MLNIGKGLGKNSLGAGVYIDKVSMKLRDGW